MSARVVVIGGGIAGLAAAVELRRRGVAVEVFEHEEQVGGLARTLMLDGIRYEFGPHFVTRSLAALAGVEQGAAHVTNFEAIWHDGALRSFPFGLLREPRLATSVGLAYVLGWRRRPPPRQLRDYLRRGFGPRFAAAVAEPLIEKWAGATAAELAPEMAGRLDPPQLGVLLHHLRILAERRSRQLGRAGGDYWVHPHGGVQAVCDGLVARHGIHVRCGATADALVVERGKVQAVAAGGREWPADAVVTTLPRARVNELVHPRGGGATAAAGVNLPTRAVLFVGTLVARERVTHHSWTWFPDGRFPFYRVYEPKNTRPDWVPRGQTLLLAEVSCDRGDERWGRDEAALGTFVRDGLMEAFGLRPDELEGHRVLRAPHAYPVMREDQRRQWDGPPHVSPLDNLVHAGRFGDHRHWLMHDAYRSGVAAANVVLRRLALGPRRSAP